MICCYFLLLNARLLPPLALQLALEVMADLILEQEVPQALKEHQGTTTILGGGEGREGVEGGRECESVEQEVPQAFKEHQGRIMDP